MTNISGVLVMTQMEEELLSALKALREAALAMTSGRFTGDDMERYQQALDWSKRVISLAEGGK